MRSLWKKIVSFHQGFSIETLAVFYLSLVGIALYAQGLTGGPVFDDNAFIFKSPRLLNAPSPWVFWISGNEFSRSWPLSFSLIWILYKLVGLNYLVYNVLNLTLHIINSILLFSVTKRFFPKAAFISSLIFLIHPMQAETVCWIFQLKTILATLFFLLSLICVLKYKKDQRWRWLAISSFFIWLSFESKPIAIFAPVLFHFLLVSKNDFSKWKAHLKIIPFWLIMILSVKNTILGVLFDPYEDKQKDNFQGISNPFFATIESIFLKMHSIANPDTTGTQTYPQQDRTTLQQELAAKPFDSYLREQLFSQDYQLNKNPKKHLSWMLKHDPYNISFAKSLIDKKLPFHTESYFLDYIDALIKKMPTDLSLRLTKIDLLLKLNKYDFAKNTFIQMTKAIPYATKMDTYLNKLNLQHNCKIGLIANMPFCSNKIEFLVENKDYFQALKLIDAEKNTFNNEYSRLRWKLSLLRKIFDATNTFINYFKHGSNEKSEIKKTIQKNIQALFKYEPKSLSLLEQKIHLFPKKQQETIRNNLINILKNNTHNKIIIDALTGPNDQLKKINNDLIQSLIYKGKYRKIYQLYKSSILNQSYLNINNIINLLETAEYENRFHFLINFYQLLTDKKVISYSIDNAKFNFYSHYLGDYRLAYKTYQSIRKNYPHSQDISIKMLEMTLHHQRFEKLKSILDNDVSLLPIFYRMIIDSKNVVAALEYFPQLSNITSFICDEDAMSLALILKEKKRTKEAIVIFAQLFNKRPYYLEHLLYAKMLLQHDKIEEANTVLESLYKLQPSQKRKITNIRNNFQIKERSQYKRSQLFPLQNLSFYFTHFLVPHFNSLVYDHQISSSPIRTIIMVLFLIFTAGYTLIKKNYSLAKLMALFFLASLPILGFYYVPYMKFSYVADHWAYLAIAPLAIFLSLIILKSNRFKMLFTAAFILFFAIQSFGYISIFNDEHKVLKNAMRYAPDEYSLYMELGSKLLRKGRIKAAKEVFEQALTRKKLQENILILDRLLYLYHQMGKNKKAVELTEHLAPLLIKQKRGTEAAQIIKKALIISPDHERLKGLLMKTIIDSPSE